MDSSEMRLQRGFPENQRANAASLYDEAFGPKLSVAIRSVEKRRSLLQGGFMPEFAIVAMTADELVGIAGFHTPDGSLTGGIGYRSLISQLGLIEGNWAALILSLYDRKPHPGQLLMDGIAVRRDFRGRGVGSLLLDEVSRFAAEQGCDRVRLDVIDINSRAKLLYERKGFRAVRTEKFLFLKPLLGFASSTTMELHVSRTT